MSDDSDSDNTPPLKTRDKVLKAFGFAKREKNIKSKTTTHTFSNQPTHRLSETSTPIASTATSTHLDVENDIAPIAVEDKSLPPPPNSDRYAIPSIFVENILPPTIRSRLPRLGERIESMEQLVYCNVVLLQSKSPSFFNGINGSQDSNSNGSQELDVDGEVGVGLERKERAWVRSIEGYPEEQQHLRWLVTQAVEEFVRDDIKGLPLVIEVISLGPILDRDTFRSLLSCLVDKFERTTLLDISILQGLVQLIESTPPDNLVSDDLVRTLAVLRQRLEGTHKSSSDHLYQTTLAISRLLEVMFENKIHDVHRTKYHEPLIAQLEELLGSGDPVLKFQLRSALQAMHYIPNDESPLQAVMRHSLEIGKIASKSKSSRARGEARKQIWYMALMNAKLFVRYGRLHDFSLLIREVSCRNDRDFQMGICQILAEVAMDSMWNVYTRQQALEFLAALYSTSSKYKSLKDHLDVKHWILGILIQLSEYSDLSIKNCAHSILQTLDLGDDIPREAYLSYPLKSRLPRPKTTYLLERVYKIDTYVLREPLLEYYTEIPTTGF